MFPTEELIESLKHAKSRLNGNPPNLDNHDEALIELIDSLINYYEWKQKPFMDAHTKDK